MKAAVSRLQWAVRLRIAAMVHADIWPRAWDPRGPLALRTRPRGYLACVHEALWRIEDLLRHDETLSRAKASYLV